MSKLIKLTRGEEAIVDANQFQLAEISVPLSYVDRLIKVSNVFFNIVDCEDVCVTECGYVIPVKYLKKI